MPSLSGSPFGNAISSFLPCSYRSAAVFHGPCWHTAVWTFFRNSLPWYFVTAMKSGRIQQGSIITTQNKLKHQDTSKTSCWKLKKKELLKVAIETQLITYKGKHDSNDFAFLMEAVKIRKKCGTAFVQPWKQRNVNLQFDFQQKQKVK